MASASGETVSVPLVALVPVQDPEAVQLVALVLLQVSMLASPLVMEVGDAERVTVGVGVAAEVVAPTTLLQPLIFPAASTART